MFLFLTPIHVGAVLSAFDGFRSVYRQANGCFAFATLPSPTNGVPFYCMLMDFGEFGMVSCKNAQGVNGRLGI